MGESAAFIRSDDPKLFPGAETIEDTSSGPTSPDLEIFSTPIAYKVRRSFVVFQLFGLAERLLIKQDHGRNVFPMDTFALHSVLLRPKSKGTLRLRSADPWAAPRMDPK